HAQLARDHQLLIRGDNPGGGARAARDFRAAFRISDGVKLEAGPRRALSDLGPRIRVVLPDTRGEDRCRQGPRSASLAANPVDEQVDGEPCSRIGGGLRAQFAHVVGNTRNAEKAGVAVKEPLGLIDAELHLSAARPHGQSVKRRKPIVVAMLVPFLIAPRLAPFPRWAATT